jgi:hypothetical protein
VTEGEGRRCARARATFKRKGGKTEGCVNVMIRGGGGGTASKSGFNAVVLLVFDWETATHHLIKASRNGKHRTEILNRISLLINFFFGTEAPLYTLFEPNFSSNKTCHSPDSQRQRLQQRLENVEKCVFPQGGPRTIM